MKTTDEIIEEFIDKHDIFLMLSKVMIGRQMVQERLLSVMLSNMAKRLPEDARRDLINELYKINLNSELPKDATEEERFDRLALEQQANEYLHKFIDDVVKGAGAGGKSDSQ